MFENFRKSMRARIAPTGDHISELRQDLNARLQDFRAATHSSRAGTAGTGFCPSASRLGHRKYDSHSCGCAGIAPAYADFFPARGALPRAGLVHAVACGLAARGPDRPAMPFGGYHHALAHFHTHTATVPALYAVAMLMLRIRFPIPDRLVRRLQ